MNDSVADVVAKLMAQCRRIEEFTRLVVDAANAHRPSSDPLVKYSQSSTATEERFYCGDLLVAAAGGSEEPSGDGRKIRRKLSVSPVALLLVGWREDEFVAFVVDGKRPVKESA